MKVSSPKLLSRKFDIGFWSWQVSWLASCCWSSHPLPIVIETEQWHWIEQQAW